MDEGQKGVVVTEVEPGSVAQQAGIRPEEVIVSVGGQRVDNVAEYREALDKEDLGPGIRMRVLREGVQRFVFLKRS